MRSSGGYPTALQQGPENEPEVEGNPHNRQEVYILVNENQNVRE